MEIITKKSQTELDDKIVLQLHQTLHSNRESIEIDGELIPVETANNGCRKITYNGMVFMEQNKNKSSKYSSLARAGIPITWGIRKGYEVLIEDSEISIL